ncbi:MAG: MFS transporter [Thermodesulfobacteriota bacterium]
MDTNRSRAALSLQYFLYFGVLGIFLPFFNLYCYHLGFSGFQIGALFSVNTGATVIFPVLWGALADRFGARKPIYVLCNVVCAGAWSFFLWTTDFLPMLIITVFFAIFRAPVISFMEAFSMDILGTRKTSYGKIRAWGTASFVAIVILMGRLTDAYSVNIIVPLILAGMLVQSLGALLMPAAGKEEREKTVPVTVLARKKIVIFLVCGFLMLVSHGTYYGFFSIHLERLGFGNMFIGFAWALASMAEIIVMISSRRLFDRFALESVLVFSFFAACARWILMYFAASAGAVLFSQLLHAITYAAFHMASILYMDRVSPEGAKTVGQALNNSVSFGLGMMVGVFVNGYFFDLAGSTPLFLGSAAVAAAGGLMLWPVLKSSEK